jgi:hypothetical protein
LGSLPEENYYLLILLQPTELLANNISNRPFSDYKSLILCLGACHFILKTHKQVLGLYMRLISILVDGIVNQGSLL